MINSIIPAIVKKIKIQPNISEQEKKRQRIYDLLNAETTPKFLCLLYTKQRKTFFFTEKELFKEKGEWRIEPKTTRKFLTALATAIKKETTTSIRKHANKEKFHEKTVRIDKYWFALDCYWGGME